ncbi:TPA: hypothetical protein ACN337_003375 [Vibrio parahaemolyticus]
MKHSIYKTCLDNFKSSSKGKRLLRERFGKNEVTHEDFYDFCSDSVEDYNIDNLASLFLLKEESAWSELEFPIIFIDDVDLLHMLRAAKFSFKSDCIQRPFKTFSISFPEGTYVEGQEVKNCLVSIRNAKEWVDMFNCNDVRPDFIKDWEAHLKYRDEQIIKITYAIDNNRNIEHVVSLSDIEQMDFDQPELVYWERVRKQMIKIVISLCIYNSATEGKKLISGFPKSALKLPKGSSKLRYKGATLFGCKQKNEGSIEKRKIKYRVPFYRNLRAKRYYQGEYRDLQQGSRWVLVKEIDLTNNLKTLIN